MTKCDVVMWCYDNILVNVAACVIPGCVRACARARAVLSKQEHKSKKRSQSIYPPTYPLNKILFVTKSYIPIIKPTRCTNFSNLFWSRNLHVSDRFTVYHQESITVYTAIDICHTGYADYASEIRMFHPDLAARLLMMDSKPVRNM